MGGEPGLERGGGRSLGAAVPSPPGSSCGRRRMRRRVGWRGRWARGTGREGGREEGARQEGAARGEPPRCGVEWGGRTPRGRAAHLSGLGEGGRCEGDHIVRAPPHRDGAVMEEWRGRSEAYRSRPRVGWTQTCLSHAPGFHSFISPAQRARLRRLGRFLCSDSTRYSGR